MSVTFYAPADESPEVLLLDSNARLILENLGLDDIDGELFGSCPAQDFLGRVLVALAIAPQDAGRPTTVDRSPAGSRIVNYGRVPGFLQDKLVELQALAEYAIEKKLQVVWA